MKWAVSPVTWHAGNDWAGCCGITTDNKRPDLPIQKWRRTTHRSMRCVQETAPLFITKARMRALYLAAGKRSPTPSLSTEIAPLCQFQSSERDAFTGPPSILTLRSWDRSLDPEVSVDNSAYCLNQVPHQQHPILLCRRNQGAWLAKLDRQYRCHS
jgi:hypothetical protein